MRSEKSPTQPSTPAPRILFVAEAVTLAHVARPLTLARALLETPAKIDFACAQPFHRLVNEESWSLHSLQSIAPEQFMAALAAGKPVYDFSTLNSYVKHDLQLIDQVKPNLIIGDFRLSLSVSARLRDIPYATISNAYWSPYARPRYHIPELPLEKILGPRVGGALFRLVRPLAFALHTRPMNKLRRAHGLPSLGTNLNHVYTEADHTLYADIPELIPTFNLPSNHHYLGPINWIPSDTKPDWWDRLPPARPTIYVTLGSSGQGERLQQVLDGLATLPVNVIAATAGQRGPTRIPENAWVTDFLPGDQASKRAALVICNGGSPTTHQALAAGVPVIGIANNLDQYLNMDYLQQAGVGQLLRSGQISASVIKSVSEQTIDDANSHQKAQQIARLMAEYPSGQRFRDWLGRIQL